MWITYGSIGLFLLMEDPCIHLPFNTASSPVVALASDCSVAARRFTVYFLILLVTSTCLENHPQLSWCEHVCKVTIEDKHTGTHWLCRVCGVSLAQEKVSLLVPLMPSFITVSPSAVGAHGAHRRSSCSDLC